MSEFPSWLWIIVAGIVTLVLVPTLKAAVGWVWTKVEAKFTAIDTGIAGLRAALEAAIVGQQRAVESLRTEMQGQLQTAQNSATQARVDVAELRAKVDVLLNANSLGPPSDPGKRRTGT